MAKPENAVCLRRRTWRPNFRECLARLSDKKPASIARSASAAFEHPGGALFAFSAKTRSVGTIAFVGKANAKKADESGFPDEGKHFPDRPI